MSLSTFGIELELFVVALFVILGADVFAPFEVETAAWKKITKWSVFLALVLGLYPVLGHGVLIVTSGLGAAGMWVHWRWCRQHGIDPLRATPRRRYYELRGWRWPTE